ncbi:ABC transporter substrate-binding protein [Candidatus Gracilibacteria bacterium]|nr:ABC transporter substrate-binding protein [Candidatus Gracilibacteria bacterium]
MWHVVGGVLGVIIIGFLVLYHQFFIAHSHLVPTTGGIFTESTIGTIKNLNPLASNQSLFDQDLSQLIYEGLLRYNPASGQIENALAEFRISEDSKTYFLTLKQSSRFQSGDPVMVDDVLFTFESVIQNPAFSNKVLQDAFEYVSLEIVDKSTIAFVLPEQNVFFLSLLTTPILPAKYFKNALIEEVTDPDFPFNKNPIGAGPYKLKNIIPADDGSFRIFLTANKYYYAGKPNIEQMVFYVYPSFQHLNAASGDTTLFSKIPFVFMEQFEKKLNQSSSQIYQKREYILPRFTALFFNLDRPFTSKPGMRSALKDSLDKAKILEKEKGWNQIDSFFFFEGIDSWHKADFPQARVDLRDGGFPYNENLATRTQGRDGSPVVITLLTATAPPVYSRFAQSIARTWEKELNIKVQLEILDSADFQEALKKRDYDVVLFGQNFSKNFDSLSTWHSSQSGGLNLSNLTHDDLDFLIDEVRFSGAQSDLFALNDRLEEIIPAVTLATPQYNILVSQDLKGFSENFGKIRSHSERFSGIENWYFFEKLDWDWLENKSKLWGFIRWMFGTDTIPSPSHEAS